MKLSSAAFEDSSSIPVRYACDGAGVSPPLRIDDVPEEAAVLALTMDDPDIPDSVKKEKGIEVFDHWVVFNMPPDATRIGEATEPKGVPGINSGGFLGYTPPCPPDGEHRYRFKLYALRSPLDLPKGSTKADVERAAEGRVIESAELIGTYTGMK